MSLTAIVTMLILCGTVWGGFGLLIRRALRREAIKLRSQEHFEA